MRDRSAFDTAFINPDRASRPGFRWWWLPGAEVPELVREIGAMADAGFSEVEIAFSTELWADEAQRRALLAVLREAEIRQVGVAVTLGAEWPLRTPNTSTGTRFAAQELQYGMTVVPAHTSGRIEPPRPFDDPEGSRGGRLIALSAARVRSWGPRPTIVASTDPFNPGSRIVPPPVPTFVDPASLRALPLEDAVSWPSRDEEEVLFAFWQRDTEQGVTNILDEEAAGAALAYIEEHQFGDEVLSVMRRVGTDVFEDSLELNADSLFWTDGFFKRFTDRFGYDVRSLLPLLFTHGQCRYWVPNEEPVPDFDDGDGIGARVRHDYGVLLTDLYVSEHLRPMQAWAADLGLRYKVQAAYGQNLEPIRSNRELARAGGRPEGESLNSGDRAPVRREHFSWRFALDWQRSVVAGAHQGGAARISTELGAQFQAAYQFSLGDYQRMLDKEWAAGITRPFVHGFASQPADAPWPSQSRFWDLCAESWNDQQFPEWSNWPALTEYWARGTVVLETGLPRTDVAVYRDGYLTTAARSAVDLRLDEETPARLADLEPLERRGYSVQFIDPIGLTEAIPSGKALLPNGPAYRVLVLDERAIPADAAEAIYALATGGLPVVFVGAPPRQHPGSGRHPALDARVRDAVTAASQLPTVTAAPTMAAVPEVLAGMDVQARAAWDDAPLLTQWRDDGTVTRVLVYNTVAREVRVKVSLDALGGVRELDLASGRSVGVPSTTTTRTHLHLVLGPQQVRVLEVDPDRPPTAPCAASASAMTEVALSDWRLEVEPASAEQRSERLVLSNQGPADWRSVPRISQLAGRAVYTAQVQQTDRTGLRSTALHLGDLQGSAVVHVGQRTFGPVFTPHAVVDLADSLVDDPEIRIDVRTPLRNAVVAAGVRPIPIVTTQPLGLIGPVKLLSRQAD